MGDRRFDVVFLDAGGVLVQPDPVKVTKRFGQAGVEVDDRLLFEAHYRGVLAIDDAESDPEVFSDYHHAYAEALGLVSGSMAANIVINALIELWTATGLWSAPLPWAVEALAAIAATDIPIVIVSNADGTVAEMLAGIGLCQVGPGPGIEVAAVIDSGAVGVAKPDPAIFTLALEAAGGVAPERAVHVGDTYQYDVRGARAAGVHPVLVDPLDLRGDVDCDRITTLTDLPALLT